MRSLSFFHINRIFYAAFALSILLVAGCTTSPESASCGGTDSVELDYGGCLTFEVANLSADNRNLMEQVIRQSHASVHIVMPVDDVTVRVIEDPANTIPEQGIGGYNPSQDEVRIYINPNSPFFVRSLNEEVAPTLAHELHHLKRRRTVGYGSTLLEAMVTEGLADHFSMEVIGSEIPIWSTALQGEDLDFWLSEAMKSWTARPYDHRAWFVGTTSEIPRWTGYAVGFKLVQDYLSDNPGKLPSDLVDEPATSFIPAP